MIRRVLGVLVVLLANAGPVRAAIHAKSMDYKHGDTVLEGYLAYDDSYEDKRPGVIVVHEWKGLGPYAQQRAEQLAQLGYVAFAIDMYRACARRIRPRPRSWRASIRKTAR